MCVGEAWKIMRSEGLRALVCDGAQEFEVDLSLIGPQSPGTWVLGFLGAAREVLDEAEAMRIRAAIEALRSIMAGGGPGDAFADLEAREPHLPPHLEAARLAGRATG